MPDPTPATDASALETPVKASTQSDERISTPNTVAAYVERYRAISPKSAIAMIELAETIRDLEHNLGDYACEQFYQEVGLDQSGSTVRKLRTIGKAAVRLRGLGDRLSNNWTTNYELAKLSLENFSKVVDSGVLNPFVTARAIQVVVKPPKATDSKPKFRVSLNLSNLSDGETKSLVRQLNSVAKKHAVKLESDRKRACMADCRRDLPPSY